VHCPETAVADVGRGRMPGGGRFRAGGRLLGTCGRRRAAAWRRRWDAVRADLSRCGLADEWKAWQRASESVGRSSPPLRSQIAPPQRKLWAPVPVAAPMHQPRAEPQPGRSGQGAPCPVDTDLPDRVIRTLAGGQGGRCPPSGAARATSRGKGGSGLGA
jgi:hypothetical protein